MASSNAYEVLKEAGFESIIHVPGTDTYNERLKSFFNSQKGQEPSVVALPESAEDVSKLLKTIVHHKLPFTVRSGGHMCWEGTNCFLDSVSIDFRQLKQVTVDSEKKVAHLGPGALWREVYPVLESHGVTVAGGREGSVGVGGFLLGGGISYFACHVGLAFSQVVEYEVVLANGDIINVNKESHPDLFQCLKGGGLNFGLVTKFTMKTIDGTKVWGGARISTGEHIPRLIKGHVEHWDIYGTQNKDTQSVLFFKYMPDFKDLVTINVMANIKAERPTDVIQDALEIPTIADTTKKTTYEELARAVGVEPNHHNVWIPLNSLNREDTILKATTKLKELALELQEFQPDNDWDLNMVVQSIPRSFGCNAGEDVTNLNNMPQETSINILLIAMTKSTEKRRQFEAICRKHFDEIRDYIKSVNAVTDWHYLNYSNPLDKPMLSYGKENLDKIREVAAKYDPEQVFQKLAISGSKITRC